MLIGKTLIPGRLISAIERGSLVVFAGAGVSSDSPSGIPLFQDLAITAALDRRLAFNKGEPPERIFGRLHTERGVSSSLAIWSVLSRKKSKPNSLHLAILRLFGSVEKVRLVTTNFDGLFEDAAGILYGSTPNIYDTTALPQGEEFGGIIHLHGLLKTSTSRIIASDEEFGEAYLTEGCATRFLLSLFQSEKTILFIGYSHNDQVMEYLARGLPLSAKSTRYALAKDEADSDKWAYRGISQLPYSEHSELPALLNELAIVSSPNILSIESRIRGITTSQYPTAEGTLDNEFVKFVVQSDDLARFFRMHASPSWLSWLRLYGFLDPLFSEQNLSPSQEEIAVWVAQSFAADPCADLVELAGQRKGMLNRAFAERFLEQLAYVDPRPSDSVLLRWVPLLSDPELKHPPRLLAAMARRCARGELWALVWLLLRQLVEPRFHVEVYPHFGFGEGEKNGPIPGFRLAGDHSQIWRLWTDRLRSGCSHPEFIFRFWPDVHSAITAAYDFQSAWGRQPKGGWDLLTFGRVAIENHNDNLGSDGPIDVLIDMMRDMLEGLLYEKHPAGLAFIETMGQSDIPIFRRMAAYGIWKSDTLSPDEKISWLLDHASLVAGGYKHEALQLLREAYPHSNEHTRNLLLDQIASISIDREDDDADSDHARIRKQFDLVGWISRADPKCPLAADSLARLSSQYPGISPDPDADRPIRVVSCTSTSPKTRLEILGLSPKEFLAFLRLFGDQDPMEGPSTPKLMDELEMAVAADPSWGAMLAQIALKERETSKDFWIALVRGWGRAAPSDDEWQLILTTLTPEIWVKCPYEAAFFLGKAIDADMGRIPYACLLDAHKAAVAIWQFIRKPTSGEARNEDVRVSLDMLNSTPARLVEFWTKLLCRLKSEVVRKPLSAVILNRFRIVLSGDDRWLYACTRFAIGMNASMLFQCDRPWVEKNILPFLEVKTISAKDYSLWRGWVLQPGLIPDLMSMALPYYRASISMLCQQDQGLIDGVILHVAWLCISGLAQPLGRKGILTEFLVSANPAARIALAKMLGSMLRQNSTINSTIWRRWLKRYMLNRAACIPIMLDEAEFGEMIGWLPDLEPVFEEAVEVITGIEQLRPVLHCQSLTWELEKEELSGRHPIAVSKLITWLAERGCYGRFSFVHMDDLLRKLGSSGLPQEYLAMLCNSLSKAGYWESLRLFEELNGRSTAHMNAR